MNWPPLVAGIAPSIGVGLVFWYAMRGILRADRNEREALAIADAAYDAEQAAAKARQAESVPVAEYPSFTDTP